MPASNRCGSCAGHTRVPGSGGTVQSAAPRAAVSLVALPEQARRRQGRKQTALAQTQRIAQMFTQGRFILGLNADYVNQYVMYVTDRRLEELGLRKHYNVTNPAKWMSTATDVFELVNFFEQQNTNYEVNSGDAQKK